MNKKRFLDAMKKTQRAYIERITKRNDDDIYDDEDEEENSYKLIINFLENIIQDIEEGLYDD